MECAQKTYQKRIVFQMISHVEKASLSVVCQVSLILVTVTYLTHTSDTMLGHK